MHGVVGIVVVRVPWGFLSSSFWVSEEPVGSCGSGPAAGQHGWCWKVPGSDFPQGAVSVNEWGAVLAVSLVTSSSTK